MNNYKKKFYSMYSHQIECPKKCELAANGKKICGSGSDSDCKNIYNSECDNPDVFALNYLALDNNNKKSCVTCNYKPTMNKLNRGYLQDSAILSDESNDMDLYNNLPNDVKMADQERLNKMNVSESNVSNYVNFESNVYQNSIGETPVDKMAEIRTCTNGTCDLKSYGNTIANAYDKLIATPTYTNKKSCDPYQLTGILEDQSSTDNYANV